MPSPSPASAASASPLSRAEIRRIIFGLMMAMLLGALDQTIVATALPTIGRDLGDPAHLPWVVTAYLLSATSAVPIYGTLADIHGRRIMLLISISIFLAGSVLCALAPSMLVLVAARFIQGAGGGGLLALSQTIVGDILPPRERATYQPYFAMAFTAASLGGPVLGGVFAQHLSWTMIFWVNVPLGAAALLMTNGPLRRLPRHERPHKLDVAGAALLVTAVTTLLLALSLAGRDGWASAQPLGVLAASAVLACGFYLRLRAAAEPLIPLHILSDKVVLTATAAATLSIGLFLGLAVYVPILFQTLRHMSASESGLAMLPLTVGTVAGATLAGRAMAYYRHYKRLPLVVLPFAVMAAAALVHGLATLPVWSISVLLMVISVALGTLLPISTVSIQNAVALHHLGTATATANLCRQLGGAVAVAVFGAILLGANAGAAVDAAGAGRSSVLLGPFQTVFTLVALGTIAALVAVALLEERPLSSRLDASETSLEQGA